MTTADFNPDEYRAFGSFAPVYTDAKRKIWDCYPVPVARETLFVVDALAQHAGPTGVLYRLSYRRIMATAHMRYEKVTDALTRIIYDLDYLREHRIHLPHRGKDIVDWQMSPHALWIAQPNIVDALALWDSAKTPQTFPHAETQPESEPDSENQIQEPDTNQKGTRNSFDGKDRSRWIETPIENCRSPIVKASDEMLAKQIADKMQTHLTQARQMVLTYGANQCMQKVDEVQRQMLRKKINKPAALLATVLRTAYGRKQELRNGYD